MTSFTNSRGDIVPLPKDTPATWRVSGYALAQNADGDFLMVQSGDGRWHFPGGGIEQVESIADGIVRECLEETGYAISVNEQTPFYLREQHFYHSREENFYHSIQLFYCTTLVREEPDESRMTEHDKTRQRQWIRLADLTPATMHPTIVDLVRKLQHN